MYCGGACCVYAGGLFCSCADGAVGSGGADAISGRVSESILQVISNIQGDEPVNPPVFELISSFLMAPVLPIIRRVDLDLRPATERGLPIVKASISSAYQLSYHPVAPVDTRIYGNTQVYIFFKSEQVVVLSCHIVRFVLKPCLRHPNNPIGLEQHDEACGKSIGKRILMVSLLILHSLFYYIYSFLPFYS